MRIEKRVKKKKREAMRTVHRSVSYGWLVLEMYLNTGLVISFLAAQSFLLLASLIYNRFVHF